MWPSLVGSMPGFYRSVVHDRQGIYYAQILARSSGPKALTSPAHSIWPTETLDPGKQPAAKSCRRRSKTRKLLCRAAGTPCRLSVMVMRRLGLLFIDVGIDFINHIGLRGGVGIGCNAMNSLVLSGLQPG